MVRSWARLNFNALRFIGLCFLVTISSWALANPPSSPVVIHVDEDYAEDGVTPSDPVAILSAEGETLDSLPPWLRDAAINAMETIRTLIGGMFADPKGVEYPRTYEPQPGEFVLPFGKSRFGLALQGAGTLRILGGPFYYQELFGEVGVEYDFEIPDQPDARLAIRVSPLHGELALIRVGAGSRRIEGLPTRPLLGPSAGLEASKTLGPVKLGARGYARYLWDLMNTDAQGVSIYGALYCRIQIDKFLDKSGKPGHPKMFLTPTVAFFDRGLAKSEIARWNGSDQGAFRSFEDIRKFWEATVLLEVLSF